MLIFLPLYIHAMPGIVMKLLEEIKPCHQQKKVIGFVVQAGFMESETASWAKRALNHITERLSYEYLGTVVRCNAAPIHMLPQFLYHKLSRMLRNMGQYYEATGLFKPKIKEWLAMPYRISPQNVRLYSSAPIVRLNKVFIHKIQRVNGVYAERLTCPFL